MASVTTVSMPVVQVAFTTLDLDRTTAWYCDVLGFLPAGEVLGAGGPEAAALMGLPGVSCDMRWLVDTCDFFQLEFFRFREPTSRPGSRRPDDEGWSMLGLEVTEFDGMLRRLRQAGGETGPVRGDAPARRLCTRDPEGVWVELRERRARGGACDPRRPRHHVIRPRCGSQPRTVSSFLLRRARATGWACRSPRA
jgi:catechol 2,3-dioxygenase-like lactoylglutathione lyase family enzyme